MNDTQDTLDSCAETARLAFSETGGSSAAQDVALYLAHTTKGESIRRIADALGAHPSTVARTVQRVEKRRDDPVFDHLLATAEAMPKLEAKSPANETTEPSNRTALHSYSIDEVRREAKKYLRRLCEPGAFLFVSASSDKAGIFCSANKQDKPIGTLPVRLAAEFLKQDWIKMASRASSSTRYHVSEVGRSFLRRTLNEDAAKRDPNPGMAEAPRPFAGQHKEMAERLMMNPATGKPEPVKVNLGESPIGWLTRRKGANGEPFLTPEEVQAAETFRTDFEAAQMGPSIAQDWRKFLTPGDKLSGSPVPGGPAEGPMAARERFTKALACLGTGLSDVALRTCCFLEGLETCERRMGWSARSGKVVLKLALQRLVEHYRMAPFKT